VRVRPDFAFPKRKVAVFVDGCFCHGCPRHSPPARWLRRSAMQRVARQDAKAPRTGKRFWRDKLATNRARDRKVNRALRAAGWRVVRLWEHELPKRGTRNAERGTARLVAKLRRWIR
jgi:DNA mismatch endonuclease (patch repair protein)